MQHGNYHFEIQPALLCELSRIRNPISAEKCGQQRPTKKPENSAYIFSSFLHRFLKPDCPSDHSFTYIQIIPLHYTQLRSFPSVLGYTIEIFPFCTWIHNSDLSLLYLGVRASVFRSMEMEMQMKMFAGLLCLILVGFKQCDGTRQLRRENNGLFMDPNLNGSSAPHLKNLAGLSCDQENEMKPWTASANNATENNLTFRFKETRTGDVDAKKEVDYSVLPKGSLTPSGPSPKGNAGVDGQRLSGRTVGPMPIYNKADSRQSGGVGHMQKQSVSKKHIDGSSPSRGGAGH